MNKIHQFPECLKAFAVQFALPHFGVPDEFISQKRRLFKTTSPHPRRKVIIPEGQLCWDDMLTSCPIERE